MVLRFGHERSRAWTYLDPRSSSLVATAEELRRDRPEITDGEIGALLGISDERVAGLLRPRSLFSRLLRR
ncbi:MAG: hypothetical protein EOP60_09975 [Sphingomonadales bacterium]|nr:MAG: hypothetical protein EOP60_09975 [Sphingomonadales bacterium]